MKGNRDDLLSILDKCQDLPVLVAGDLIVDQYVVGSVNRISPEAPVVVVHQNDQYRRLGGAGNVAHNLASLGARVSLCSVVGDDEEGRALLRMLEELEIDTSGILVDRTRPTTVKTRVIAHAQQVVRIDKETTEPLAKTYSDGLSAALEDKLSTCQAVIVSDYGKGAVCKPLFDKIVSASKKGVVGLESIPVVVDPKEKNFSLYHGVTVIKPNRKEAAEASGIDIVDKPSATQAARILVDRWQCEMVMVTLGEMGLVVVSDQSEPAIEIETRAQEVYDVSGAGDTVSAVFTLALRAGSNPRLAAELANYAAGVVVGEVGTVPIQLEQLRQAIQEKG